MKQTNHTKIDLVKGYIEKYIELGIKKPLWVLEEVYRKGYRRPNIPILFKDFEGGTNLYSGDHSIERKGGILREI